MNAQRLRKLVKCADRGVSLPPLNISDIGTIDLSPQGKVILGDVSRHAEPPQIPCNQLLCLHSGVDSSRVAKKPRFILPVFGFCDEPTLGELRSQIGGYRGKVMDTLQGVVRNIRSWAISEKPGKVTFHMTRFSFLLDGRPVEFTSHASPSINEGDQLRVVGSSRSEGLRALAFKNLTNGSQGHGGNGLRYAAGLAILGICALTLLQMLASPRLAPFLGFALLIVAPLGLWLYLPENRARQALARCAKD